MFFLQIKNDDKQKMKTNIIRFFVLLTFVFRTIFLAEAQYNSMSEILAGSNFTFVAVILLYGVGTMLLFWVFSSLSYTFFARSKYVPINELGVSKINKPTYIAHLSFVIMIKNLILGGLNFVMYEFPVTIAIGLTIIPIALTAIMLIALFFMFNKLVGKGQSRELLMAFSAPAVMLLLFLA